MLGLHIASVNAQMDALVLPHRTHLSAQEQLGSASASTIATLAAPAIVATPFASSSGIATKVHVTMRLITMKQFILDTNARARALDKSGRPEAVAPVYETTLTALRLATSDDDPQPAWERVVATLTNTRRLLIDALDQMPVDQMRRRLTCIENLPEVSGFTALEDIYALIGATINVGAPRYNNGDVRGCAALYWTTLNLIADTPATRGFPGFAKAVAQSRTALDLEIPVGPFTPAAIDAFAWELRSALDAIARVTS